jgi:transcriptional regulator with XRE-family HTH domain
MSPARKDQNRAIDAQIGANVRTLRQAAGWSQERLAGMLGITFQQIQKYEKGQNRIAGSMLFRIAQVLNLPVGALFAYIPGAASEEDQSGFDRLATAAERDRLHDTIASAIAILSKAGATGRIRVPLDQAATGAPFGGHAAQIPAVHSSR